MKKKWKQAAIGALATGLILPGISEPVRGISWPTVAYGEQQKLASPSNADFEETAAEAVTKATPSDALYKGNTEYEEFKTEEPQNIPSWYTKVTFFGKEGYYFIDRDGGKHWRRFGSWGEETTGWYVSSATGTVSHTLVDMEEEYYTSAPYLYESSQADEEALNQLKAMLSDREVTGNAEDKKYQYQVIDPEMGRNYDGSSYDVWWAAEDLNDFSEDPRYFFYGRIKNKKDSQEARWFECRENGSVKGDYENPNSRGLNVYDYPFTSTVLENFTAEKIGNDLKITWYQDYTSGDHSKWQEHSASFQIYLLLNNNQVTGSRRLSAEEHEDHRYGDDNWNKKYGGLVTSHSVPGSTPIPQNIDCVPVIRNNRVSNASLKYSSCWDESYLGGNPDYESTKGIDVYTDVEESANGRTNIVILKNISDKVTGVFPVFEGYGWYYWDSSSSGNYSPNNYNWYYSAVMPMGTGTGIAVGKVTVGFDANGGSSSATSGEYISGSLIGSLPTAVRTGYVFDGWYTSANGGNRITENTVVPSSAVTYYAHWTPVRYTIHYDGNGAESGTMKDSSHVYDVESSLSRNAFEKPGYTFSGWQMENGVQKADGSTVRNWTAQDGAVLQLKAIWEVNTYTIRFVGANGYTGGSMPDQAITYDKAETLTENAYSKRGYHFTKWSTEEDGTGENYGDQEEVKNLTQKNKDVIFFYTNWEPNTYKVVFNSSGGTCTMREKEVTYNSEIGILPVPKKTNYRFLGWYHGVSGSRIMENTVYQDAGDVTLTAMWTLEFKDLGNNTNVRPGEDGEYGTGDDEYYFNGIDLTAGTDDDRAVYAGADKEYGTEDDFYYRDYINAKVYAGMDKTFATEDDFMEGENHTNYRPGKDCVWDTGDDEVWYDYQDGKPGTSDDKQILSGADGKMGTSDDTIEIDGQIIHCGLDLIFGSVDDYIDLKNGSNQRPGADLQWNTGDEEYWTNGADGLPGTEDDKKINPGLDGKYGTQDDHYTDTDGKEVYPGGDNQFGTSDDRKDIGNGTNTNLSGEDVKTNGVDKIPGTLDDKPVNPGLDGEYGTQDDHYTDTDGKEIYPGGDNQFGTSDDRKDVGNGTNTDLSGEDVKTNGVDKIPGTSDDKPVNPGLDGEYGTQDDHYTDTDGKEVYPGNDNQFGTEDDRKDTGNGTNTNLSGGDEKTNGADGIPGTADDGQKADAGVSEGGSHNNSSSSGGSGGSRGSGSVFVKGTALSGNWKLLDGEKHIWTFEYTDGSRPRSMWRELYYNYTQRTDWYHFSVAGIMDTGWFQDVDGYWYYLHNISDGTLGHMKTGWFQDVDGRWYYLRTEHDGHYGAVVAGWKEIEGKRYYFNEEHNGFYGALLITEE